jgi:uncharacterized coiled-coil protein SlyX
MKSQNRMENEMRNIRKKFTQQDDTIRELNQQVQLLIHEGEEINMEF